MVRDQHFADSQGGNIKEQSYDNSRITKRSQQLIEGWIWAVDLVLSGLHNLGYQR
jgi:hypothetical protein